MKEVGNSESLDSAVDTNNLFTDKDNIFTVLSIEIGKLLSAFLKNKKNQYNLTKGLEEAYANIKYYICYGNRHKLYFKYNSSMFVTVWFIVTVLLNDYLVRKGLKQREIFMIMMMVMTIFYIGFLILVGVGIFL